MPAVASRPMSVRLSPFRYKLRLVPQDSDDDLQAPEEVPPALDGWELLSNSKSPEGCRQFLYRRPA